MNIRSGASQEGTTVGACAYPVGLFLACFAFSYLDRQIMSILVEPLKATLHISDIQIGILQGFSFTLCYATAGVIISRMVDSANRVRLIAVCVAIWACSTMLCATAGSYTELLIWRGGTAIAEAALSPAVLSLFADMFIASRLTRATGIFMLGPYIGSGLALTGGGMLLGWLTREMGHMPGLAAMHPWQWVFLIVGLPGILLSILVFFTVSEPARRNHQASQTSVEKGTPAFRDVLNELLVKNRFCLPFYFAYTCLITLFYSLTAWFPTVMMRHFTL
ncbi:MFS transporter, partial [Klebsiella quasipneumoniae]